MNFSPTHVIIAYDITVERLPKVYHIMKRYLNWIQNSAFEGDLTPSQLEELKIKISEVIDQERDCVVVFSMENPRWLEKTVWGKEKGNTDSII